MCRFFLYAGPADRAVIRDLFKLMLEVSRCDAYGVVSGIDDNHPDGWGIYYLNLTRGTEMLTRSGRAIYEDLRLVNNVLDTVLSSMKDGDSIVLLLHIRAASTGEPLGPEHAHPYAISIVDGTKIVLAHNGAVHKDRIAKILNQQIRIDKMTDSKVLTYYIARRVEQGLDLVTAIQEVIERGLVKTALNTGIVRVFPDARCEIVATSHLEKLNELPHRICYYRLYRARLGEIDIFLSSTLVYYMSFMEISDKTKKLEITPLPCRSYVYYRELKI